MQAGARRLPVHLLKHCTRRAWLMVCAVLMALAPGLLSAQTILSARYSDPTTRYDHGVLGDAVEWGTLELALSDGVTRRFILPETLVFEDTAPRLADLDADGAPEVIVVESSLTLGARLVVYGPTGRLAMTDHIGRKNRWLAPVGAADFTGDGRSEIAMVVTPHLAGNLVLLAYDGSTLTQIARTKGLTNHRIGDPEIAGALRLCGAAPEIILAQMPWSRSGTTSMVAVHYSDGMLHVRSFKEPFTPENITKAQNCVIVPD